MRDLLPDHSISHLFAVHWRKDPDRYTPPRNVIDQCQSAPQPCVPRYSLPLILPVARRIVHVGRYARPPCRTSLSASPMIGLGTVAEESQLVRQKVFRMLRSPMLNELSRYREGPPCCLVPRARRTRGRGRGEDRDCCRNACAVLARCGWGSRSWRGRGAHSAPCPACACRVVDRSRLQAIYAMADSEDEDIVPIADAAALANASAAHTARVRRRVLLPQSLAMAAQRC